MKNLNILIYKIKLIFWKLRLNKYKFENTTLDAISASQIITVVFGNYRPKNFDENGSPIDFEEIIEIIFPNGSIEKIIANENNIKYANQLISDLKNKPKP